MPFWKTHARSKNSGILMIGKHPWLCTPKKAWLDLRKISYTTHFCDCCCMRSWLTICWRIGKKVIEILDHCAFILLGAMGTPSIIRFSSSGQAGYLGLIRTTYRFFLPYPSNGSIILCRKCIHYIWYGPAVCVYYVYNIHLPNVQCSDDHHQGKIIRLPPRKVHF